MTRTCATIAALLLPALAATAQSTPTPSQAQRSRAESSALTRPEKAMVRALIVTTSHSMVRACMK